jgi:hypothetical protein
MNAVMAMPATSPASKPAEIALARLIISILAVAALETSADYSKAMRKSVAKMREPATNVPRNVPETLDMPPVRQR